MNKEMIEALNHIQKDINNLEKQKETIKNIDLNKSVTETEWHNICLTPLRNTTIMKKLLKNIFPNATDIKVRANDVLFTLYGFECSIPTWIGKCINLNMSWNYELKEPTIESFMSHSEYSMRLYFETLDNHGQWELLFNYRLPTYKNSKKIIKFFMWFGKYKWKDVHREKWEEQFKNTENKLKTELETYKQKKKNIEEKRKLLHEKLLPKLYNFTNKVLDMNNQSVIIP